MSTVSQYYFKRILINSGDSDTPSDLHLRFSNALEGKFKVQYISIPNTLYNVNETNNTIRFNLFPSGLYAYPTIPVGNYTGDTLAIAVQAAMSSVVASPGFTAEYDSFTRKLSISRPGTDTYQFLDSKENTAWKIMGLPRGGSVLYGSGANILLNPINIARPLSVGIRVHQSPDAGYVTPGVTQQGTLIAPLTAQADAFNYTPALDFEQFLRFEKGTKTLDILIVNPLTGVPVDLNGGQWEMLIERIEPNFGIEKLKRIRY